MPKYKPKKLDKNALNRRRQQYYRINNNSDLSHIYYSLNIFNNNTGFDKTGTAIPIRSSEACIFNQMREKAYLDNPSDYAVTFVKFSLDSNSFPNQIVQPIAGKAIKITDYTYDTIFSIGLATNIIIDGNPTISVTMVPVTWKPADSEIEPPTSGTELLTTSMISDEYFWNYSYQYFIDRVNIVLEAQSTVLGIPVPYFKYDSSTGLISLYSVSTTKICLNEQLYNLFAGFTYKYQLINDVPLYELIPSVVYNSGNIIYYNYYANRINFGPPPTIDSTNNYLVTTQSYKSTQLWNPAVSLVFTSKTLGVVSDDISEPFIYGINPNETSNNANVSNSIFEYLLSRRADPTINDLDFNYLFKDLLSNEPQKDLVIEIFWKDDFGNLHPFYIESGSNCSIKLLFRKDNFEVE
jgi:hypothetical protein